jgi:hypothetical protein
VNLEQSVNSWLNEAGASLIAMGKLAASDNLHLRLTSPTAHFKNMCELGKRLIA